MQAILYIAHGSRVKAGVEQAVSFLQRVQREVAIPIQEICFLELADPSIAEGIERCVHRGATAIAVIPLLLLAAKHAKHDIPEELEKAKLIFPELRITYGEPLGVHDLLIDTLQTRITETQLSTNQARVLLIGRGSSDTTVIQDLTKIAERLREKYFYEAVDICFLYGAGPTFDEWLQQDQHAQTRVFIVPYLLFTGLLRQGITKRLVDYEETNIILCESLGYDDNVKQVVLERTYEVLQL